jgi:HEAT repeat protein
VRVTWFAPIAEHSRHGAPLSASILEWLVNPWFDAVDRLSLRGERYDTLRALAGGVLGARASRGRPLSEDRIDALIWGLAHANPVVRRCCLELLDLHPNARAADAIARCLDDPVPRVRWHAAHTLTCDACKAGGSYLSAEIRERLKTVASTDPSAKVRAQAAVAMAS